MTLSMICLTMFLAMVVITLIITAGFCLYERQWGGAWIAIGFALLFMGVGFRAMGV